MKNLQTLFIILTASLFFTACQKEEMPETFDTISGALTAGENVSAEDLNGTSIHLGKLYDGVDPTKITSETQEIDYIEKTTIKADGSFEFTNLVSGNYVLFFSEEYLFANDTFAIATIDYKTAAIVHKQVDRVVSENGCIGTSILDETNSDASNSTELKEYEFHIQKNCDYTDMKIKFYENDILAYNAIDFPNLTDWEFKLKLNVNAVKSIRIECRSGDTVLSSSRPLKIPFWFNTSTEKTTEIDGKVLTVKIKSCMTYKKITISN